MANEQLDTCDWCGGDHPTSTHDTGRVIRVPAIPSQPEGGKGGDANSEALLAKLSAIAESGENQEDRFGKVTVRVSPADLAAVVRLARDATDAFSLPAIAQEERDNERFAAGVNHGRELADQEAESRGLAHALANPPGPRHGVEKPPHVHDDLTMADRATCGPCNAAPAQEQPASPQHSGSPLSSAYTAHEWAEVCASAAVKGLRAEVVAGLRKPGTTGDLFSPEVLNGFRWMADELERGGK